MFIDEFGSLMLIDNSALHHELHAAQSRNVARRITFNRDKIRKQSILHTAKLFFHVKYPRVD